MKTVKVSSDKYICINPNMTIITFDNIFQTVVIHGINILYNIHNDACVLNKLDKDIQHIFTYLLLEHIYDRMKLEDHINTILYINSNYTHNNSEAWSYIEPKEFKKFITKICKKISRLIPIPVYIEDSFVDISNDSGEVVESINNLEYTLNSFRNRYITLQQFKKFSKQQGLDKFLDKYHNETNFKNNLFYNKYFKGVHNE